MLEASNLLPDKRQGFPLCRIGKIISANFGLFPRLFSLGGIRRTFRLGNVRNILFEDELGLAFPRIEIILPKPAHFRRLFLIVNPSHCRKAQALPLAFHSLGHARAFRAYRLGNSASPSNAKAQSWKAKTMSKAKIEKSEYEAYQDRLLSGLVIHRGDSCRGRLHSLYVATKGDHAAKLAACLKAGEKEITQRGEPPSDGAIRAWARDWNKLRQAGIPKAGISGKKAAPAKKAPAKKAAKRAKRKAA